MSINLPQHAIVKYADDVRALLQYQGSKIRPYVTEGMYKGKAASPVDQYGAILMEEVTQQFQEATRTDFSVDRRWVYPRNFVSNPMADRFDILTLNRAPDYLAANAVVGARRKIDEILAAAFFADAKTGTEGGTTEAFDTTNFRVDAAVGATADTTLNAEKVFTGLQLMQDAEVDVEMEDVTLMITPFQNRKFLADSRVSNSDFVKFGGVITNGRVTSFAGVNVLVSTLTPANASYTLCPLWVKSGMHLGIWNDIEVIARERPDINGTPMQFQTIMSMGATRLEQGRVVQIECTKS